MALRARKPIKPAPPDPNIRYELWGYRPGQPVTLRKAPEGVPAEKKGSKWRFRSVRVDDQGNPVEVYVYGGAPGYESSRCFPVERIVPPSPRQRKKLLAGVDNPKKKV